MLPHDKQKKVMKINNINSKNYYGKVVSGIHNQGRKIELNESPVGFRIKLVRKRDRIMGFDDDEEENACDRDLDESQQAQTSTKKKYNNHRLIFFKEFSEIRQ